MIQKLATTQSEMMSKEDKKAAAIEDLERKLATKADATDVQMPQALSLQAQRRALPEADDAPERQKVRVVKHATSSDQQPSVVAGQAAA